MVGHVSQRRGINRCDPLAFSYLPPAEKPAVWRRPPGVLALGHCRRLARQNQSRLLDFPSLAPNPSLHVASGANEVVLQSHFDQATIASVSQSVPADQLALRAFNAVAVLHPLLESFGLLLLPTGLQRTVMLSHDEHPMFLFGGHTLLAQRAACAMGTPFKSKAHPTALLLH